MTEIIKKPKKRIGKNLLTKTEKKKIADKKYEAIKAKSRKETRERKKKDIKEADKEVKKEIKEKVEKEYQRFVDKPISEKGMKTDSKGVFRSLDYDENAPPPVIDKEAMAIHILEQTNNMEDIVKIALRLLKASKTTASNKVSIMNFLADRSLGKPVQTVMGESNINIKIGLPTNTPLPPVKDNNSIGGNDDIITIAEV